MKLKQGSVYPCKDQYSKILEMLPENRVRWTDFPHYERTYECSEKRFLRSIDESVEVDEEKIYIEAGYKKCQSCGCYTSTWDSKQFGDISHNFCEDQCIKDYEDKYTYLRINPETRIISYKALLISENTTFEEPGKINLIVKASIAHSPRLKYDDYDDDNFCMICCAHVEFQYDTENDKMRVINGEFEPIWEKDIIGKEPTDIVNLEEIKKEIGDKVCSLHS